MTVEPRIYVADLAAYNAGHLHGVWIDATLELDDIWKYIHQMLADSPIANSEEYAIHDFEGFYSYHLSEYEGIEQVHAVACFIEEHEELGAELLNYFSDIDEAQQAMEERYCGCFKSLADYAEDFIEQTQEIPDNLQYYIEYEKMARDWELSGDIVTIETVHDEIHIFYSH